jgi:hypothetical protein
MARKADEDRELTLEERERQHVEIISYCRRRLPWVWIRNRVGGGLFLLTSVLVPMTIGSSIIDGLGLERGGFLSIAILVAVFGGFVWLVATHDRLNKSLNRLAREEEELRQTARDYESSLGMIRIMRDVSE